MKFVTSNSNKIKEAEEILERPVEKINLDLKEIQDVNVKNVVAEKIKEARKEVKEKFIVEDTALYLGKEKEVGALIKFFPNERVVKAYRGERAIAVCAIGYSNGEIFLGKVKGTIVKPRGENGFDWDKIFQPNNYQKTFAEMTKKKKNDISHRKLALLAFKKREQSN